MRLLLDTHALLWALADPDELSTEARDATRDGANEVFVSSASTWEISIKQQAGKLEALDDLLDAIDGAGFTCLSIDLADAMAAGALPAHHRDPFDRMLIAQARARGLTVVTRDARFVEYGVPVVPA